MFKFFKKIAENFKTPEVKETQAQQVFKKTANKRKKAAPHVVKEARKVLRKKDYQVKHAMKNIEPWEKKEFFSVLRGMKKSAAKNRRNK